MAVSVLQKLKENSDLFGDSSSEEEEGGHEVRRSPASPSPVPSLRSPSPQDQDSFPSGRKARKSKPKSSQPKKPKKSEVQQLYSDSQRMVRESSLNIPKYEPRKMTLDPFLNRLKKTQDRLAARLRPCDNHIQEKENLKMLPKKRGVAGKGAGPQSSSAELNSEPSTREPIPLSAGSHSNQSKESTPGPALTPDGQQSSPTSKEVTHSSPSKDRGEEKSDISSRKVAQKQKTLTSIFTKKPLTPTPSPALATPTTPPPPAPVPSGPRLSSGAEGGEEMMCFEIPEPVEADKFWDQLKSERLQDRLKRHMEVSKKQVMRQAKPSKNQPALLSPETVKKLSNRPGAAMAAWKSAMRERVSQVSRARFQEQKVAEATRKLYEEEMEEEEEEEMSDGDTTDTSDDEFIQAPPTAELSDVCSDLDEEEGVGSVGVARNTEREEAGSDSSDDDDEPSQTWQLKKKSVASRLLLDSDEEEGEPEIKGGVVEGACLEEGSMPPLRLDSVEDEESLFPVSQPSPREGVSETLGQAESLKEGKLEQKEGLELEESQPQHHERTADSGISQSLRQDDVSGDESEGEEPEKSGRGNEEVLEESTVTDADSLELSFQWGQSTLPLAQPFRPESEWQEERKKPVLHHDNTINWEEESQWPTTPLLDQTQCLGDETQLLDEDGFLCIRKEKAAPSPRAALWGAIDSTQQPSPSELLHLCSGEFPSTPPPGKSAAGGDTQVVRHLLGLAGEGGGGESRLSEDLSEDGLVGLCSGMFPASQTQRSSAHTFSEEGAESRQSEGASEDSLMGDMFPASQTQRVSSYSGHAPSYSGHASSYNGHAPSYGDHASSKASVADTSDGISRGSTDSGDEEREEGEVVWVEKGGSVLERWAKQHQQMLDKAAASRPTPVKSWAGHDTDSEMEDDNSLLVIRNRKLKVKQTKEERLAEFVESEAELSGEDVGSDLDEEEQLYADQYEEEEGVAGEEPITEGELWDQVNKAHLKHMFADDKADLQDLKERFLKEGDLYEDGLAMKNGFFRTRRFAQTSEAGSLELFTEDRDSGGEGEETSHQTEAKRRRDRLEKEEFIRKCKEREESLLELDEDSQTLLSIITDTTSQQHTAPPPIQSYDHLHPSNLTTGRRVSITKCSSFLKRDSKPTPPALQRSDSRQGASVATPTNIGAGTGRRFVFQRSTSSAVATKSTEVAKKPLAGKTARKSAVTSLGGPLKKPKLARSHSLSNGQQTPSIFTLYQ